MDFTTVKGKRVCGQGGKWSSGTRKQVHVAENDTTLNIYSKLARFSVVSHYIMNVWEF